MAALFAVGLERSATQVQVVPSSSSSDSGFCAVPKPKTGVEMYRSRMTRSTVLVLDDIP